MEDSPREDRCQGKVEYIKKEGVKIPFRKLNGFSFF